MRFCEWMRKQRGTRESSLANYRHVLCKRLQELGGKPHPYVTPSMFDPQHRCETVRPSQRARSGVPCPATACLRFAGGARFQLQQGRHDRTAIRMFVRFRIVHRECADSLQYAIPRLKDNWCVCVRSIRIASSEEGNAVAWLTVWRSSTRNSPCPRSSRRQAQRRASACFNSSRLDPQ
jgi:hypothetical protein